MEGFVNKELLNQLGGQAMGPTPQVTPGGGIDWNLISMMLGRAGQAFSAEEPQSWQHQLGGLGAQLGESRKFAKAATKAREGRKTNWDWLRDALGGVPTPQGSEGFTSMKVGRAAEGKLPEITLGLTPSRDIYDELFGGAMESTSPGLTEPITPSVPINQLGGGELLNRVGGGAGRPSAMHPFLRDLPGPS